MVGRQLGIITEYPELQGTHKGHGVQLLGLHRTSQQPDHVSESIVQTS